MTDTALFNIVSKNFFEPSIGTPLGGNEMIIYDFENTASNVKFVDQSLSQYTFYCSTNSSKLICISPIISIAHLPLFSAS
eukprot:gene3766-6654_t